MTLEAADRLAPALALGAPTLDLGFCPGIDTGLDERDRVERAIQPAVAAPVEPMTLYAARLSRNGRRPVRRCEVAHGRKAPDVAHLSQDPACYHWADADDGSQADAALLNRFVDELGDLGNLGAQATR